MTSEWCPTRGGKFIAYEPEWRYKADREGKQDPTWRKVRVDQFAKYSERDRGVPYPFLEGGVISAIGLSGYSQAHALAWQFAAFAEAEGKDVEVRVQAYEVVYDIKARKIEEQKPEPK